MRALPDAICFAAGGLRFPYYVGVIDMLRAHAGLGSAALAAAVVACGVSSSVVFPLFTAAATDWHRTGVWANVGPRLDSILASVIDRTPLPGRVSVAIAPVAPWLPLWHVSTFSGPDDFRAALSASCHIPWYCNGQFSQSYRDHRVVDGGLVAPLPVPQGFLAPLRVSCFPVSRFAGTPGEWIAPDANLDRHQRAPSVRHTLGLLRDAVWPAAETQVHAEAMRAAGFADAMRWLHRVGCVRP